MCLFKLNITETRTVHVLLQCDINFENISVERLVGEFLFALSTVVPIQHLSGASFDNLVSTVTRFVSNCKEQIG